MDTSALRPTKQTTRPQRTPYHKAEQSQTTIDLYLKPVTRARQGQNDIRNYFPPVAKTKVPPNDGCTNSRSLAKTRATSGPSHDDNGATERQISGPSPNAKVPVESTTSILDGPRPGKKAPGAMRARNHTHANSAVLPNFDPFFENADFPHSTSSTAPRVTDVVRHSLLPMPLKVKVPLPPTAEAGVSPSQITSSPSSVGDVDTASPDEERREAPSFKQTYVGVHSRQNTNDGPISPLMALRDSTLKPLNQRVERPAALRSKTMPQLSEPDYADSVIYFLPKISPTSDSEAEEWKSGKKTRFPKPVKKAKAERRAAGLEREKREDTGKQNAMTISPGLQRYYDYLASQKNAALRKEKTEDKGKLDQRRKEKEVESLGPTDEASSGKKKKKKRGKGLLRLMEAYSRHVEGLQMIQ